MSYAYRLTNTEAGSNKYGPCEVCQKYANTIYLLTQSRRYAQKNHKSRMTHHNCISKFGHKNCLAELTYQDIKL